MTFHLVVTNIQPHPRGLQLRVVHRSERTGWVQFATLVLPLDDLDDYLCGYVVRRLCADRPVEEADEPLF